ncbi:unnamed protein product [Lampetra fluviatilis]
MLRSFWPRRSRSLRLLEARSSFSDMMPGTSFWRVIPEEGPVAKDPGAVRRFIFCCGKVYYDLARERDARGMQGLVAICRLEQVGLAARSQTVKQCRIPSGSEGTIEELANLDEPST